MMGGKAGCDPLHFSPEIFKPGSPYIPLWENKFGINDGTLQMHFHMLCGINCRNTHFVVTDQDWNVRCWAKICHWHIVDLSKLNPRGYELLTLLSNEGTSRTTIFDILHTYMERAISSLPERGSKVKEEAEGLNFHLSRNYASWMKKQGYMAIHPFASEEMRLVLCARNFFHIDSVCRSKSLHNRGDCKESSIRGFTKLWIT